MVPSCRVVAGIRWCYVPNSCGETAPQVCGKLGLPFTIDDVTWFNAQDTLAECQAISDAFGLPERAELGPYTWACLEDEIGFHDGPGLERRLICSTVEACPTNHRSAPTSSGCHAAPTRVNLSAPASDPSKKARPVARAFLRPTRVMERGMWCGRVGLSWGNGE
jgi:hypothetical protein